VKTEKVTDLAKTEAHMLRWMAILAISATFAILLRGHFQASVAFGIGALLGMLNFHWLAKTVTVLLDAQVNRVSRKVAILMVVRYPLAFAGLVIMYYAGGLPLLPMIAGLLVPGGGVFLESLLLIGAGLRERQTAS
jgi:hypothetical protein